MTTEQRSLLAREPLILSRAEHPISRRDIDENALKVMYRLASENYLAYLVGGGVRDLFLQKKPKDFDVTTDARPSRLKKIFRNCRIIGRRFRIAHVYFPEGKIIEVSTFRRGAQTTVDTPRGKIILDNEYGSPQEDALRRDITINGLFYDINNFSVIDYVGGVQDLRDRIIRTINDPDASFREDPVRMIRVERHAARTGFEVEALTLAAIHRNRNEIRHTNPARLLEEVLKDLKSGASHPYFQRLCASGLFACFLPSLAEQLRAHGSEHPLWRRLHTLDQLLERGASYTSPLLLSVLLHTVLFSDPATWFGGRNNPPDVWRILSGNWREIGKTFRISRRDTERVTQILISFRKLVQSCERGIFLSALRMKPYLAEAIDFLQIDLESQGKPTEMLKEWRRHAPPPPPPEHRYRTFEEERGGRTAPPEPIEVDELSLDPTLDDAPDQPPDEADAPGGRGARPHEGGAGGGGRKRRRRRGGRRHRRRGS